MVCMGVFGMVKEESMSKLRDMDELLKENLVNLWFQAINLSIANRWAECFEAYKSMFNMIEPYNFASKNTLSELVAIIGDYLKSMGGKPVNMREIILFNEKKVIFRDLMDEFMSLLPKAFVDLDLWFKSVPNSNDYDIRFSEESFGDELSLVNKKRKVLSKLSVEQLLSLLSSNALHDAYSRGLSEDVL
jgi:hypothetical protein